MHMRGLLSAETSVIVGHELSGVQASVIAALRL